MQPTKGQPEMQRKVGKWYSKEHDDMIIQRWAEACSEMHNGCRDCQFQEDCQDLMDRLIAHMYIRAPRQQKKESNRNKH